MRKFIQSIAFLVLLMALQHSPVWAQNTINGVIARVTQNGLQLKDGTNYRWSDNTTTTLSNGNGGSWGDLQADDAVRLTINGQNKVTALTVTGRSSGQRIERSLLELDPVQGKWATSRNVTINGRVFERAVRVRDAVVIPNRDNADVLEAQVGLSGEVGPKVRATFIVLGDGQEIYRSPIVDVSTPPTPISVPIKGFSGVTLRVEGNIIWGGDSAALWVNPLFVNLPATIPIIDSPVANARITRNTPLVWEAVDGATAYLFELQCISLNSPNDATNPNRFVSLVVPAETTIYNFNVNQMPKGRWRWRIHSLSDTGILGEMTEWRIFTSQ